MAKDDYKKIALECVLEGIGTERFSQETRDLCHDILPHLGAEGLYAKLCSALPFEPEMTVTSVNAENCIDVMLRHAGKTNFYVFFRMNVGGTNECFFKNMQCEPNGCGVGAKFLASFMNTLQGLGIESIHIKEAIDIGLSFWPKIGFVISQKSWEIRYREELIEHINMFADDYKAVDAIREKLLMLVEEEGEYSLCYIANMVYPKIDGRAFSQFFLSPFANEEAFEWGDGVFHFPDRVQMNFLKDYFERKGIFFEDHSKLISHSHARRILQPVFG